tara:strand:+ start:42 stop:1325 length:1284 start_codon:yes stop_codon:yes gene_type:complete
MAKEYKVFEGTKAEYVEAANKWMTDNNHPVATRFYEKFGVLPGWKIKQSSRKGEPKKWIARTEKSINKSSNTRKENTRGTNPEIDAQIERLDKQKAWPPGKSKKGFLRWQGSVYSEAQREANAWAWEHGYKTHAGHGRAAKLGGPNARTNLAPEGAAGNLSKQETGIERADWELDEAGISRSKTHAFQEYLMEGTSPKVRNFNDYSALVRRILVHNTDIPIDQAMSIAENELIQRGPQVRSETKVSQKNIKSLPETTHLLKDAVKSKLGNLISKTRTADLVAQTATGVATGNVVQASVAGGTLATTQVLQNPQVQKRIARQIADLVTKRGAKTAAKLVPGVDIVLSAKESWDYLKQGRLDQAGIAALSGAIGWVPVIGDGASAALDFTNTGIDISRLDFNQQANTKKKKIDTDLPNNKSLKILSKAL